MARLVFACRAGDELGLAFMAALRGLGHEVAWAVDGEAGLGEGEVWEPAAFWGGFSRGARRVVERVAAAPAEAAPRGLVLMGYPFHPKGRPTERTARAALAGVPVAVLVLQGERDAHGNRQAVGSGEAVGAHVQVAWLADGNHRLVPRAASGLSQRQLIEQAAARADAFMRGARAPG